MKTHAQQGQHPQVTIHHRIWIAREWAGMDQFALAKATGIGRNTISNYETGATTHMKPLYLSQIAEATGATIEWLLTGVEDEGPSPTSGYVRNFARSSRLSHTRSGSVGRPVAIAA